MLRSREQLFREPFRAFLNVLSTPTHWIDRKSCRIRRASLPFHGLLRDLKSRGLKFPRLTVGDGHLGIWAAFGKIYQTGAEQRCWNHKITNVINDLPKPVPRQAAERLKAMPYAERKGECERRRDVFVRTYHKTNKKVVETLLRDWDRLMTVYALPREHWRHLRTTNIV
jgi:putative transposase